MIVTLILGAIAIVLSIVVGGLVPKPSKVYARMRTRFASGKLVPGHYHFPEGNLAESRVDYEGDSANRVKQYGETGAWVWWGAGLPICQFYNADWLQQLLQIDPVKVGRDITFLPIWEKLYGKSIVASGGETWQRQRRILSKAFSQKQLVLYQKVQRRWANRLAERLRQAAQSGEVLDMILELKAMSENIITECIFGAMPQDQHDEAVRIFRGLLEEMPKSIHAIPIFRNLPIFSAVRNVNQLTRDMRALFDRAVTARRQTIAKEEADPDFDPEAESDRAMYIVDVILRARDTETRFRFNDEEARDNMFILVAAGTDTVASTMNSLLHHSFFNPGVMERLYEEVDHSGIDPNTLSIDDQEHFPYLFQVMEETLRVSPPLAGPGDRVMQEDVTFTSTDERLQNKEIVVPKGMHANCSLLAMHNNPLYWDKPEEFRPERFDKEEVSKRHPYVFLPFGLGRRVCTGRQFAYNEMLTVLPILLREFKFVPQHGPRKAIVSMPNAHIPLEVKIELRKH